MKTLPELGTTSALFFLFGISQLIVRPGFIKPSANQFDILPRRLYPARRFLLERMKHVDSSLKCDRVNHPIRVCAMASTTSKTPGLYTLKPFLTEQMSGIAGVEIKNVDPNLDRG